MRRALGCFLLALSYGCSSPSDASAPDAADAAGDSMSTDSGQADSGAPPDSSREDVAADAADSVPPAEPCTATTRPAGEPTVVEITAGASHSCARDDAGKVYCWGNNSSGQLGSCGTPLAKPALVAGLAGATKISAGDAHTCAVAGKQLWCWGSNFAGELARPDGPSHSPVAKVIASLADVADVEAGYRGTCASTATGDLLCWGLNDFGQVGNGSMTSTAAPAMVLSGVTAFARGDYHGCALSGGALKCWGGNTYGQLGDGTTSARATPVAASAGTVVELSTGTYSTCAVLADGSVRCWGRNDRGQLGDGTTTQRLSPTAVAGVTGATKVAVGSAHACAIVTGGAVSCWGGNDHGQLGDGTTTVSPTPVSVTGLAGVTSIAAGVDYTCALASGKVKCWGANASMQLGDGSNTDRPSPTAVAW